MRCKIELRLTHLFQISEQKIVILVYKTWVNNISIWNMKTTNKKLHVLVLTFLWIISCLIFILWNQEPMHDHKKTHAAICWSKFTNIKTVNLLTLYVAYLEWI